MDDKKTSFSLVDDNGIEYEIKIKGYLKDHWSDWLGGLEITLDPEGNSRLCGIIPDQAALHGILAQIRDLGLPLISLTSHGSKGRRTRDDRRGTIDGGR